MLRRNRETALKLGTEEQAEAFLEELGDEASKPLFVWPKDNTHLKYDGAVQMVTLLSRELERFGSPYRELLYVPEEE